MDVDGDKKDELVARDASGYLWTYSFDGVKYANVSSTSIPLLSDANGWNNGIRFIPMDIDGDGRDDFLARSGVGAFEYNKSSGTGFQNQSTNIYNPDFIKASAKYTTSGQYISELTDTFGNKVKYEYNESLDQLTKSTDPRNNPTIYNYDAMGRVLKTEKTLSDQSRVIVKNSYENDRLKTITKNGYSYSYNYDQLGNLLGTSVVNASGSLPLSSNAYEIITGSDQRQYNTGELLSTTYGNGQKTGFTYDSLYRVTAKSYNDAEKFRYQYDNSGNLAYKKDLVNNIDFRYIYNLANRLVQVKDITNKNSIKYEYDDNNNISKASEALGNKSYDTVYTYDKDNKLKTITYGQNTKTYNYDTLARLVNTQLKTAAGFNYNTSFTYAPGIEGSTSTRIKDMTNNGKTISYTHDNYGNIQTVTSNGKEIRYAYNELNELVREDNQVLNKTINTSSDCNSCITLYGKIVVAIKGFPFYRLSAYK